MLKPTDNNFPLSAIEAVVGDTLAASRGKLPRKGGDPSLLTSDPCAFVEANLPAFCDSELSEETLDMVAMHLENCPNCANAHRSFLIAETLLYEEWCDSASLLAVSEVQSNIDAIMEALPLAPESATRFASKRIHSKARWSRLSTGAASLLAILAMLWSSYRLGYAHGSSRSTLSQPAPPAPTSPKASTAPPSSPALRSAFEIRPIPSSRFAARLLSLT